MGDAFARGPFEYKEEAKQEDTTVKEEKPVRTIISSSSIFFIKKMGLAATFNIVNLEQTNCGKTFQHLLKLLETQYKNHFDYIYFVCPTFPWNQTYQNWSYVNHLDIIIIDCDHDDVDYYLKLITFVAERRNSLIIIDDCASSQAVKNRTSEIVRLGFSARHCGLSFIVITQ